MRKFISKYKSVILCLFLIAAITGLALILSSAGQAGGKSAANNSGAVETNKPASSISLEVENSPASTGNTDDDTPADSGPENMPVITSRLSSGIDSVTFSWAPVDEAKGYEIYRSESENEGFIKIGDLNSTTYKDTGLVMGKSYYYKVRADFGTNTTYGPFTEAFEITPAPLAPRTLRADLSDGGIELTWSAVEGATEYEIYRSNTPDGEFKKTSIVNATSFLDKSFDIQTYYYKVRARAFADDGTLVRGAFTIEEYAVKGDITDKCTFTSSVNADTFGNATDNQYKTAWDSGKAGDRYIDISVGNNYKAGGLYLVWETPPQSWDLYGTSGGKRTLITHGGEEGYLTQFVYIPSAFSNCGDYRLVLNEAEGADVSLAEISVFTSGNVPYYAPLWQPFAGRTDILTLVAHPDDEDLYMGAPAPFYADEGKRCVTVFMTYGTENRRYEGQESAWTLGNKNYPVMRYAEDVKTDSIEGALKYWTLDDCVSYIVEQIRKFKPSVIVTHDVNGEYGHGAHRLTQYAAELAFKAAGNPDQYPDSAKKYGTWKPGKLYVHLDKDDALDPINIYKTLKAFGGKTDYEVVSEAYARHKSQLGRRALPKSGEYDMRAFGLMLTNLGEDKLHDSMFENVTEEAMLALNPWYGEKAEDRSVLEDALKEAKSETETYFTSASWRSAGLEKAIAEAQSVYVSPGAAQYQVEAEAAALYEDIGMLVPA